MYLRNPRRGYGFFAGTNILTRTRHNPSRRPARVTKPLPIPMDYEPRIRKAMGAKALWRHVEGTVERVYVHRMYLVE